MGGVFDRVLGIIRARSGGAEIVGALRTTLLYPMVNQFLDSDTENIFTIVEEEFEV